MRCGAGWCYYFDDVRVDRYLPLDASVYAQLASREIRL
jgi:hypothetical protein